jgi:hypothetical protein
MAARAPFDRARENHRVKVGRPAIVFGVVALALSACPASHPNRETAPAGTLGPGGFVKPFIPSPGPAEVLDRPLRFPRVLPGQSCPITRGRERRTGLIGGYALGPGPAYPILAIRRDRNGIYHYGSMLTDNGWWIVETSWMIDAREQGAMLLRGASLTGAPLILFVATTGTRELNRQTTFGKSPPIELYGQLVLLTGKDVPNISKSGTREYASATAILGPGCYAFQVDGKTFSNVIVFQTAR